MSEYYAKARYEDARFFLIPDPSKTLEPDISVWQGGIKAPEFSDGARINTIYGRIQLPHSYKEGSNIVLHLHWGHKNAGASANIVWQIEWWWANVNGTSTTTTSATAAIACASADANKHLIADVVTSTGTGMLISSVLMCRIFRDPAHASDNYAGSIWLLDADAHVIFDTIGSNSIGTKA